MSTFTTTHNLEQPARGADVGTWDTPVNSNMNVIDAALGAITTIGLNNSNIVLSAGQFQSKELIFNSTLTGSVAITFPTTFTGPYTIQNLCTGSSAFTITLTTTATGQVICCPPAELFDCWNDGTNIKFRNFDRIGSYMDYAGSSVPGWVSGCTIPPYLNCDGTTFSSAAYPALTLIVGGTTLPDLRGRGRIYLNQGTGRITSSQGGVDGNTLFASGGVQATTLSSQNIPPIPVIDPGHLHGVAAQGGSPTFNGFTPASGSNQNATFSAFTGITAGSTSPTAFPIMQPAAVGGLTMIRAG
jgi:hypothetical protein